MNTQKLNSAITEFIKKKKANVDIMIITGRRVKSTKSINFVVRMVCSEVEDKNINEE